MSQLSKEHTEEIRRIVRDEIHVLGLPNGLMVLIRACMMVVRWAQKTKRGMGDDHRL